MRSRPRRLSRVFYNLRPQRHRRDARRRENFPAVSAPTKRKSSPRSRTPAPASRRKSPANCSSRSPRTAKPTAPASACPSAKKSSRIMAGESGPATSRAAARFFVSRCRWRNELRTVDRETMKSFPTNCTAVQITFHRLNDSTKHESHQAPFRTGRQPDRRRRSGRAARQRREGTGRKFPRRRRARKSPWKSARADAA